MSRHAYASSDSAPSQTLVGQKLDPHVSFCENTMRAPTFSHLFQNLDKIEDKNSFGVCTYVTYVTYDMYIVYNLTKQSEMTLFHKIDPSLTSDNFYGLI